MLLQDYATELVDQSFKAYYLCASFYLNCQTKAFLTHILEIIYNQFNQHALHMLHL